jgi:polar amino acid transport system substrate-binding protein
VAARVAAVAAVVLVGLAGCGSGEPATSTATPTADVPEPVGAQVPASVPKSSSGPDSTCNPYASLRPGTLPPAGQLPAGSTMARIRQRGRLIVGVDQNTYLFGFRDPQQGQIVGFDIDLAKQVAKAIFGDPSKVQFKAITSAQRVPAVRDGDVDLVADTMTVTCDRLTQVAFSTVYFDAGQQILVPKDSKVTDISQLGGKKVCAAAGSTSITNIAADPSHPVPVSVADWTDCLVMLQQDQVAAISTDSSILAGMAAQDPGVKVVGKRFTDEPYGMAIKQSNTDLVRFVNGVLAQLRSDGTWTSIYDKWLGSLGPAPAPPAAQYLD